MMLAIDTIVESPANARRISGSADADKALCESIAALGLLQPVLVVRSDAEQELWELRAGHRRLAACRALGHTAIAAVELDGAEQPEVAISAAENMVRAAMHPVDQWRALAALQHAKGFDLNTAATALGIAPVLARRMSHLGSMDAALLDAIGAGVMPDQHEMRRIAQAPKEVQREALERGTYRSAKGDTVNWRLVADGCTVRRIPRTRAIFDPDSFLWDEDLFAEPGAEDQFTTSDVAGFLDRQKAALAAQVVKAKGKLEVLAYDMTGRGDTKPPKGWQFTYDSVPKRWRKDDPRRAFAILVEDGWKLGSVTYTLAEPVAPREQGDASDPARAPAERPPINKKTLQQLAVIKAKAVQERLEVYQHNGPAAMLRALLLLFTCRNVQAGGIAGSPYGMIASKMVNPDGTPNADLSDDDLCALAAWLIGTAITFDAPDQFKGSGNGAEWIAMAIAAEMPRTDTADILKGINGDTLAAIAENAGVSSRGTVGALRKRLAGALADWRAVTFGAAGPIPGDHDDDDAANSAQEDDESEAESEAGYGEAAE